MAFTPLASAALMYSRILEENKRTSGTIEQGRQVPFFLAPV